MHLSTSSFSVALMNNSETDLIDIKEELIVHESKACGGSRKEAPSPSGGSSAGTGVNNKAYANAGGNDEIMKRIKVDWRLWN